jgi:hypothetical protein
MKKTYRSVAVDEVVPGEFTHWLSRATVQELMFERSREANKPGLEIRFRVLAAIDEELFRREASNSTLT